MKAILLVALAAAAICPRLAGAAAAQSSIGSGSEMKASAEIVVQCKHFTYAIGADGSNARFVDRRSGADLRDSAAPSSFATIRKNGAGIAATSVEKVNGHLRIEFGDAGVTATVRPRELAEYVVFEVVSVEGQGVEELALVNLQLAPTAEKPEDFAACALALNLQTNVLEIPGPNTTLRAMAYPRFGFAGAQAAVAGCAYSGMRKLLQQVVSDAPELPHAPLGGPWALDAEISRGSYLFNFGGLSEQTVDAWIDVAKQLGINQIDFHGGSSFRFGDCRPNPETYPNGRASLKAVIDKLHAAGIKAGLHTYAHFIDKSCPWVTPVPDPRLATDAVFTLSEPVAADAAAVPVTEPTTAMSTVVGFFERNSVTLRIDNELIVYSGISKEPPYSFTGCTRGAYGTTAASHGAGAKAYHLKECFGLFAPDGDSTLLEEVAARAAEMYNECGFDMMYLDALDGEDVLGGWQWGWHYGSKFVFELVKRLERPALMEMSTFHHHLWYVRSRIGAMDHPRRSHKRFIDIHCEGDPHVVHAAGNRAAERMFMPAELGWWAVHTADDLIQGERTFPDDIEYLMCRCLATNTGFALMGINPDTIKSVPAYEQLAPIFRNYENLRHAGYFPQRVLDRLGEPGAEFTLQKDAAGKWQLWPVRYARHKVTGSGETWRVENPYPGQPLQVRIEALMSAAPYDSPDAQVIEEWKDAKVFGERGSAEGVTADMATDTGDVKTGSASVRFTARNAGQTAEGAWTAMTRVSAPPFDISARPALGLWVKGDGKGELLNLQILSPKHLTWGIGDHYVKIDFTGWRYFELIEPEGGRVHDYEWPYGHDIYGIYRENVNYSQVEKLSLWYNNLPPGEEVDCLISPIRALSAVSTKLINPAIEIDGRRITFPVEIPSGSYLEFRSMSDCRVYGPHGELAAEVTPVGETPAVRAGGNDVTFTAATPGGESARAWVTVISRSEEPLGED